MCVRVDLDEDISGVKSFSILLCILYLLQSITYISIEVTNGRSCTHAHIPYECEGGQEKAHLQYYGITMLIGHGRFGRSYCFEKNAIGMMSRQSMLSVGVDLLLDLKLKFDFLKHPSQFQEGYATVHHSLV